MKLRTLLVSAMIVLSSVTARSGAESDNDSQWGLPINGLQMSISEDGLSSDGIQKFQVQFRNIGKRDFVLNLGRMLGNGRVHLPDRVALELTDSNGKTQNLKFFHNMFVAGRVDDYLIPLKLESTYSITVRLDQFYSRENRSPYVTLPSGKTKILASLDGMGAMNVNSDTPGIALMEFWTGKAWSNTVVLQR
jgi:hypothetical protein